MTPEQQRILEQQLNTEKLISQYRRDNISASENIAIRDREVVMTNRSLTEELKDQLGIRTRLSEEDKKILALSRNITSLAEENNAELRRAGQLQNQIIKDRKVQAKLNREIAIFETRNIEDQLKMQAKISEAFRIRAKHGDEVYLNHLRTLSSEEQRYAVLIGMKQQMKTVLDLRRQELSFSDRVNESLGITGALFDNLNRLGIRVLGGFGINLGVFEQYIRESRDSALELAESFSIVGDKVKESPEVLEKLSSKRRQSLLQEIELEKQNLKLIQGKYSEAQALSGFAGKEAKTIALNIKKLQEELYARDDIQSSIAGAAKAQVMLSGKAKEYKQIEEKISALLEKQSQQILNIAEKRELKDLIKSKEEIALQVAESNVNLNIFGRQLKTLKVLSRGAGTALSRALTDPAVLALFSMKSILEQFGKLDRANVDFRRNLGQTPPYIDTINLKFASTVDYVSLAANLTEKLGINVAQTFTPEVLGTAAEFMNLLGLSAEQVGSLALRAQATNVSLNESTRNIIRQVNAYNRANRSAIAHGMVLRDVANVSDGLSASLGGNAGRIAEASAAARRLGLELAQIESVASTLLNFESSIEDELTAQLLTGRAINLNRARELALVNEVADLGREIFDNQVSLTEFANMNRIQQEGLAKALGISRDQLARAAYLRSVEMGMTEQQAATLHQVNLEDMKRLSTQESLAKITEKLSQLLVGPAALLTNMVESSIKLYSVLGLIGTISLGKAIMQIATLALKLKAAAGASITLVSTLSFGTALAAVVTGITAMHIAAKKAERDAMSSIPSIQDGIISPTEGLIVSGPKGSIQLDPQDSIVAGTDLKPTSNTYSSTELQRLRVDLNEQSRKDSVQFEKLLVKVDELVSTVKKGGTVTLDGDKVGSALVMGSYKM